MLAQCRQVVSIILIQYNVTGKSKYLANKQFAKCVDRPEMATIIITANSIRE